MVAPRHTALSTLGGGGGSDGPPALKSGGDRLPITLPRPGFAQPVCCWAGREAQLHAGPTDIPREGLQAPPASAKQVSYYHMVQGGWVFRNVFCSIRPPFLVLSRGAVFPLCLSMDSGSRLLQLPIWETPEAKRKQRTQHILVHLPELLCSPPSSTYLSESTRAFVML